MDFVGILHSLKGKVLDAAHFDLLKHAYELQEKNGEQLRHYNDALKEGQALLRDKVVALKKANKLLTAETERLRKAVLQTPDSLRLSQAALAILRFYKVHDAVNLPGAVILGDVEHSRIEVESGLKELSKADLVQGSSMSFEGANFGLTAKGKRYVLDLANE